ncbi:hypothetical protein GCK72_008063 [Caenorhabditis remanei]|uniref:Uncharacterized protein n=1 Tax=Caenorhabditis remanei TaxID=31234 RepID=A0A6A5HQM5_CAERE|nr:hypothetical protein GCK72_008063 [Caenorhabditis remanei]KAF1768102.1 hypothetical protein GCK72_008063 [Caenorhabditis remanei]
MTSIKGWYEIRGKTLFIWEGVLSLYPTNLTSCQLYKILQDEIFEIHVEMTVPIEKIDSDGYWECVEINGEVSNGAHFLCHSMNTEHAERILKVLPSAITSITVRMDPNPCRNWERSKIKERIVDWQKLMQKMCEFPENSKIILDGNMLS